jgi:hypothetical protein
VRRLGHPVRWLRRDGLFPASSSSLEGLRGEDSIAELCRKEEFIWVLSTPAPRCLPEHLGYLIGFAAC